MELLVRESDRWLQLSHKNVQPYFGHCFNLRDGDMDIALISPFCRNGNIMEYIKYKTGHSADNHLKLKLVTDVVNGLEYLQSMDIVHGHLISVKKQFFGSSFSGTRAEFF